MRKSKERAYLSVEELEDRCVPSIVQYDPGDFVINMTNGENYPVRGTSPTIQTMSIAVGPEGDINSFLTADGRPDYSNSSEGWTQANGFSQTDFDLLEDYFPDWLFEGSGSPLPDYSLIIRAYQAAPFHVNSPPFLDPDYIGAELGVQYNYSESTPINDVHWISIITNNSTRVPFIDGYQEATDTQPASDTPYYDEDDGTAGPNGFYDQPGVPISPTAGQPASWTTFTTMLVQETDTNADGGQDVTVWQGVNWGYWVGQSVQPIAVNANAETATDTADDIDVLGNCFVPPEDSIVGLTATNGSHGTTVVNDDNTITYTPDEGYKGTDSFDYTFTDVYDNTYTATVNMIVDPATHFSVSGGSSSAFAGGSQTYTVTALDSYNNTVTWYNGSVGFSSTDARSTMPTGVTLTDGVGTFTVTNKTAGPQFVRVWDPANPSAYGDSSTTTVSPTAATSFAISTDAPAARARPFHSM